jgi:hypothetical protein
MSHFVVLVIGNDPEAALAPFQENNMGDCPAQYLKFHDSEDEYLKRYNEETRSMVRLPDGRLVSKYDRDFKVGGSFGISSDDKYVFPDGSVHVEVPHKEQYATFEEFMNEYCGYEKRDEKTGRYGYWENPNKKWDWYQIGGRWSGLLRLKPGAQGNNGTKSLLDENRHVPNAAGYCDQARAGDIDWEAMIEEKREKARVEFDKIFPLIDGQSFTPWSEFVERAEKKEISWDEARTQYHSQQVLKDVQAALGNDYWGVSDEIQGVIAVKGSRGAYVENMARDRTTTWAMVYNGEWIEKGRMGWFATSDATEESTTRFIDRFYGIINSLPADEIVTVVDCHI